MDDNDKDDATTKSVKKTRVNTDGDSTTTKIDKMDNGTNNSIEQPLINQDPNNSDGKEEHIEIDNKNKNKNKDKKIKSLMKIKKVRKKRQNYKAPQKTVIIIRSNPVENVEHAPTEEKQKKLIKKVIDYEELYPSFRLWNYINHWWPDSLDQAMKYGWCASRKNATKDDVDDDSTDSDEFEALFNDDD